MSQLAEPIAELDSVSKRYGEVLALDRVSLAVQPARVHALLGPNGAGKTTAVGLLLGLLSPDAGRACLFGLAPGSEQARRGAGAMLQTAGVPDTLTVDELIALFRGYYPRPRSVADTVAHAGVGDLLKRPYGRLSGGQQRRVQFALAICGDPRILFLDEPTTGLDVESRAVLWQTIRGLVADGCAVVLTTHYLEEAEALADHVDVLAQGRIVASGDLDQIRSRVDQKRVRCVSALTAEAVSGWPDVRSVTREGSSLEIVTTQAERVVRRLLDSDHELRDLEVRRAGLAEAFVQITREAA
jgi:ABC-2 type transport system ATP-binding protein